MYAMDKERFGRFVAELRKEKGMTQKDLARGLYVSDKAVSKWERGLALPDVALLIPLAETLGVTVTELLEGRRLEKTGALDAGQVEALVKRTIGLAEGEKLVRPGRREIGTFALALLLSLLEVAGLLQGGHDWERMTTWVLTPVGLAAGFGIYFWFFTRERLPDYYDQNELNFYSHGIFRMNLWGVRFTNRNWPYILRAVRWWTVAMLALWPLVYGAVSGLSPELWHRTGLVLTLAATLGGLFVPVYIAARKKE